jgi:6-pyruvoyltetrahydropterin/6-carboxytetrahydropterin synthase
MVVEFAKIKRSWKTLIDEVFDHSFLHNVDDPLVPDLLRHNPHARLIPFPGDPTTEMIAALLHNKMQRFIDESGHAEDVELVSVRIDETPTNAVTWTGARHPMIDSRGEVDGWNGWWSNSDPNDRQVRMYDGSEEPHDG